MTARILEPKIEEIARENEVISGPGISSRNAWNALATAGGT